MYEQQYTIVRTLESPLITTYVCAYFQAYIFSFIRKYAENNVRTNELIPTSNKYAVGA